MGRIFYALAFLIGTIGGSILTNYATKPVDVRYVDLNEDSRPDIIITKWNDEKSIFLQLEDGEFTRLEDVGEAARDSIEARLEELE